MSGGKTYTAVEYALKNLADNQVVCSNIRLKCRGVTAYLSVPCVFWKRNYYYLTEQPKGYHDLDISDYDNYPVGSFRGSGGSKKVFIYYDEVTSVFDSLTSGSDARIKEVATWARQTEKRGQFLYLIMQFTNELHKRLRSHITEYITCVNTANIRLPFIKCRLPSFMRHYILRSTFGPDGETRITSAVWFYIDSRIFSCYDTGQIVFGSKVYPVGEFYKLDFSFALYKSRLRGLICLLILNILVCSGFMCWLLSRWV